MTDEQLTQQLIDTADMLEVDLEAEWRRIEETVAAEPYVPTTVPDAPPYVPTDEHL